MKKEHAYFFIYLALLIILNGLIIITPIIAHASVDNSKLLYGGFSLTCHQKISRSLCLFNDHEISDCTPQEEGYVPGDSKKISTNKGKKTGYKFPVCSRCMGLYIGMLIGALTYPLLWRIESRKLLPGIVLILAIIPFALDGTVQLLTSIFPGIIGDYESANLIRLSTAFIAGAVVSFFIIPISNIMFNQSGKR